MKFSYLDISKMIDHSLLQPTLSDAELEAGCRLALEYNVASVCIKPYYLKRCAEILAGSTVKASTTIGFPHGGHTTRMKVLESQEALDHGGQELDMVVNIGKVLSGDWHFVRADIQAVVDAAHARGQAVKVIFENCFLADEHKIRLCEICGELGADFVKTSTGYGDGGATIDDLKLMRKHSPAAVQVKAAGGVRTLDKLLEVRALGVSRVGASRTAEMLDECRQRLGGL
jgi:deoxyribose-phosphate aldolase